MFVVMKIDYGWFCVINGDFLTFDWEDLEFKVTVVDMHCLWLINMKTLLFYLYWIFRLLCYCSLFYVFSFVCIFLCRYCCFCVFVIELIWRSIVWCFEYWWRDHDKWWWEIWSLDEFWRMILVDSWWYLHEFKVRRNVCDDLKLFRS